MQLYEWINKYFFDFDASIFRAVNDSIEANPFISSIARFISYFGDKGLFFIALTLVLLLFRKTRKVGMVMGVSLIYVLLFNNTLLKNLVARPRPYNEVDEFRMMWEAHSTAYEKSYSFPSGHTSTAAGVGVSLFIMMNKKYSWLFLLIPIVMGWSRIALFVHYPSDVLFGIIMGALCAVAAYFTVKLLLKIKFVNNLTVGNKIF